MLFSRFIILRNKDKNEKKRGKQTHMYVFPFATMKTTHIIIVRHICSSHNVIKKCNITVSN